MTPRPAAHASLAEPEEASDRRLDARVLFPAPVELMAQTRGGPIQLPAQLVDLSVHGCAVRLGLPLDAGTRVRLVMTLGAARVPALGEVIWTRPRNRLWVAGVVLDAVAPARAETITRFLQAAQRRRSG